MSTTPSWALGLGAAAAAAVVGAYCWQQQQDKAQADDAVAAYRQEQRQGQEHTQQALSDMLMKNSQNEAASAASALAVVLQNIEGEARKEVLQSLTPKLEEAALRAMREQLPRSSAPVEPPLSPTSPDASGKLSVGAGSLIDFLSKIPKTDLHVHLDGSLRYCAFINIIPHLMIYIKSLNL